MLHFNLLIAIFMAPSNVAERMEKDVAAGKPLVAHVVVVLADNKHQGIVPVPEKLGNGQDPRNNLYWGALYGLRTHLIRKAQWVLVAKTKNPAKYILERLLLQKQMGDRTIQVIAEAWDGAHMSEALDHYFACVSGTKKVTVTEDGSEPVAAGGDAHLVVFVGHNGLMDRDHDLPTHANSQPARATAALACRSRGYFSNHLSAAKANPVLMTNGLMAPEGYVVAALLEGFFRSHSKQKIAKEVATAYHAYQNCGMQAAMNLFRPD